MLSQSRSEPDRRLYQCPGCWSFYALSIPVGYHAECGCGEAATCVDLCGLLLSRDSRCES